MNAYVARTPDFGVRGSPLANAVNGKDRRLPSGWGVEEKPQTSTAEAWEHAKAAYNLSLHAFHAGQETVGGGEKARGILAAFPGKAGGDGDSAQRPCRV